MYVHVSSILRLCIVMRSSVMLVHVHVGASHGYGYASGVIHKSMVGYPDHNLGYSQAPTVEGTFTV